MLKSGELNISQFINREQLGKGGFGVVYKAIGTVRPYRDKCFAIKEIPKKSGFRVEDEINALKKLNEKEKGCTRIVKFYDWCSDDDKTYIIMEYCKEGSLRDYILKKLKHPLDYLIAGDVLSQLIEGVIFMHKLKVMHRDLTPGNVLISRIREDGFLSVKIADFGLTKIAPTKPMYQTCVGTAGYMAGEIRNREEYNESADVYSLGGILYIMMSARDPPPNLSWDFEGRPLFVDDRFKNIKSDSQDLIFLMMSKPEKRICLEDIVHHDFMRICRTQKLESKGIVQATTSRELQPSRTSINSAGENISNCHGGHGSNNDLCRRPLMQMSFSQQQCAPLKRFISGFNGRISNDSAFESEEQRERQRRAVVSRCLHKRVPVGRKCSCGQLVGGAQLKPKQLSFVSFPMDFGVNKQFVRSSSLSRNKQHQFEYTTGSAPENFYQASRSSSAENRPYAISNNKHCSERKITSIEWPLPYVRHFAKPNGYKRLNNYGRFTILSTEEKLKPSMIYEMLDKQVEVYLPKKKEKIFEEDQPLVEKRETRLYYFRSADDVRMADPEVRSGYQQIFSFIKLAKNKIPRCKMRNAFGYRNYNLELKYDGTIVMQAPNERVIECSIKGEFKPRLAYDNLSQEQKVLFDCACLRLLKIHKSIIIDEAELQLKPLDNLRLLRTKLLNQPFELT